MSNWIEKLSQEEKVKFDEWSKSYDAQDAFLVWLDEQRVHQSGNQFYGRTWNEHVKSCKKSGRDPYD